MQKIFESVRFLKTLAFCFNKSVFFFFFFFGGGGVGCPFDSWVCSFKISSFCLLVLGGFIYKYCEKVLPFRSLEFLGHYLNRSKKDP